METIELTMNELRKIHNRLADCSKVPREVFDEACREVLKKRGHVNATAPFELTIGGPVPILTYSLSD